MQSPFPFESMLVFGCLAIMLLIGVLLRAKIAFFQRFLMPSCLIGGILGLILINVNREFVPVANLETFAYHLFNISLKDHRVVSGFFNCINGDSDKIDDRVAIHFAYIGNLPSQWCINDVNGGLSGEKNMVLQF